MISFYINIKYVKLIICDNDIYYTHISTPKVLFANE